jgi:hypothetical protein
MEVKCIKVYRKIGIRNFTGTLRKGGPKARIMRIREKHFAAELSSGSDFLRYYF